MFCSVVDLIIVYNAYTCTHQKKRYRLIITVYIAYTLYISLYLTIAIFSLFEKEKAFFFFLHYIGIFCYSVLAFSTAILATVILSRTIASIILASSFSSSVSRIP